jgi:hypothetical protein
LGGKRLELLTPSVNPNDAIVVRDALWSDVSLLDSFIRQNPAGLSPQDVEVARTWRWRVQDTFMVIKHLKKYSIFISTEKSDSNDCTVYGVVGMSDPLEDILLFDVPCMVKAVLIPFDGRITYDSLFVNYPISFGRNIRGSLNRDCHHRIVSADLIIEHANPLQRKVFVVPRFPSGTQLGVNIR